MRMAVEKPDLPVFSYKFQGMLPVYLVSWPFMLKVKR